MGHCGEPKRAKKKVLNCKIWGRISRFCLLFFGVMTAFFEVERGQNPGFFREVREERDGVRTGVELHICGLGVVGEVEVAVFVDDVPDDKVFNFGAEVVTTSGAWYPSGMDDATFAESVEGVSADAKEGKDLLGFHPKAFITIIHVLYFMRF